MFDLLREKLSSFVNVITKKEEKKFDVEPGIGARVKGIFSREIEIGEKDIEDLLENLELSLLEADVAFVVSKEIISELKKKLVGAKVSKERMNEEVRKKIREVLRDMLTGGKQFSLFEAIKLEKPAAILFIGPNGAGKTTTMGKVASLLMEKGLKVAFSASDTFRAAAIEQTEEVGKTLGVSVIKSKYGADPAAVAFDAVNYARAHGIDVVLIDSAGRQDTNINLLNELRKINRVIKPAARIFIGESIAGNAIVEQVLSFNEVVPIDGVILTKLDCDAKGGTALSIAKATNVPILFFGTGQKYGDLKEFDPSFLINELLPEA